MIVHSFCVECSWDPPGAAIGCRHLESVLTQLGSEGHVVPHAGQVRLANRGLGTPGLLLFKTGAPEASDGIVPPVPSTSRGLPSAAVPA